jgi:outer membrane protein assembly factor BamB
MVVVQLGSEGDGALMGFDLATGDVKWKSAGEGPMYSSPVLMTADGVTQVVTLTAKSVVGVAPADGKLLWQIAFEPKGMAYNSATPIVDGQTVIFTGSGRGTKAVKVEKKDDAFAVTPLWSNADVACQFCTPVLRDGLLFGLTDKGSLFCISAKDGKTAWTKEIATGRSAGFAAIVDAGSTLFALSAAGELIAFTPTDKAYEEISRIKAGDAPTYAHPVISGKRVFVKGEDSLKLLTLP